MVILKYDFKQYEEVSERVYSIFYSIEQAVVVMPVSVDEAYLEFAPHCNGLDMALMIRNRVITETRCPCSAGVGPNMMLAKIATRKAKPNGQFEINAYNLDECMSELDLNELPGVGWESSRKLAVHGFKYLRDIATLSKDALQVVNILDQVFH
jgi:DNA repair protein REV1